LQLYQELVNQQTKGSAQASHAVAIAKSEDGYDSELEEIVQPLTAVLEFSPLLSSPLSASRSPGGSSSSPLHSVVSSIITAEKWFMSLHQQHVKASRPSEGRVWVPREAHLSSSHRLPGNGHALLPLMVSIVGSDEPLLAEYRAHLAEELLCTLPCVWETEGQDRMLEFLRVRFGDTQLHAAETMLRDFLDSKRLSKEVTSRANEALMREFAGLLHSEFSALESLIVSHHYWPPTGKDKPILHPSLQLLFKAMSSEYAVLRKPRHLQLLPSHGTITLQVEVNGQQQDVTCSLQQASVILYLQDAPSTGMPVKEVAIRMNVTNHTLMKLASFWEQAAVVSVRPPTGGDIGDCMICIVDGSSPSRAVHSGVADEESDTRDRDDPEAVATWMSFVMGMLTNLGPLPLDRIHSNLQLFAGMGAHPYEKSSGDLSKLLSSMIQSKKLVLNHGHYSLT
jgi:anaphase-promoting complex subunit 2